jgi:hypothetical protein
MQRGAQEFLRSLSHCFVLSETVKTVAGCACEAQPTRALSNVGGRIGYISSEMSVC